MKTRGVFQLAKAYQGKMVAWDVGKGVEVDCYVIDAGLSYGNEGLLVRPVQGDGQRWVRASKCRVISGRRICLGNADIDEANETQKIADNPSRPRKAAPAIPKPDGLGAR